MDERHSSGPRRGSPRPRRAARHRRSSRPRSSARGRRSRRSPQAAAELESTLPERIGAAVHDGLRAEVAARRAAPRRDPRAAEPGDPPARAARGRPARRAARAHRRPRAARRPRLVGLAGRRRPARSGSSRARTACAVRQPAPASPSTQLTERGSPRRSTAQSATHDQDRHVARRARSRAPRPLARRWSRSR